MRVFLSIFLVCVISYGLRAQSITLDSALSWAVRNNPVMKIAALETSRQITLARGSVDIPKTDVSVMFGQYNSFQKNDNHVNIEQTIPFPVVWARQKKLSKELVFSSALSERVTENQLKYEVRKVFNYLLYLEARHRVLIQQDSIMHDIVRLVDLQYKTGESTLLAKTSSGTRLKELSNQLKRNESEKEIYLDKLRFLCKKNFTQVQGEFDRNTISHTMDSAEIMGNPLIAFSAQQVSIEHERKKLEAARALPDISIGYFTQTLIGVQNVNGSDRYFGPDNRFGGFQVGLSIPLWQGPFKARVSAAALLEHIAKEQNEEQLLALQQQYHQAEQELIRNTNSLVYFRESALTTAKLLRHQSDIAFRNGEIDYRAHLLNLQQVLTIEEEYLSTQYEYNQNTITIHYLIGGDQK